MLKFNYIALMSFLLLTTIFGLSIPNSVIAQQTQLELIEEYKQEVRDNRPSISYVVFEPAIQFFKSVMTFINTGIILISETVTPLLSSLKASVNNK